MAEYIDETLKTVEVKDSKGNVIESKDFYLSKFPATVGREIMMRYSTTMANLKNDYSSNAEILAKMMKYVRVDLGDGRKIALETETLVNNHVSSGEMLSALENAILSYNFSFFRDGEA